MEASTAVVGVPPVPASWEAAAPEGETAPREDDAAEKQAMEAKPEDAAEKSADMVTEPEAEEAKPEDEEPDVAAAPVDEAAEAKSDGVVPTEDSLSAKLLQDEKDILHIHARTREEEHAQGSVGAQDSFYEVLKRATQDYSVTRDY
eukprot:6076690-Alexandrium_andersonii.AAC.1